MGHMAEFPYIYKENMSIYLEALNMRMSLYNCTGELLLVGGSCLILGHNFRDCTEDIDAYIKGTNMIRCINEVREMFSLTEDWLNDDFKKSRSYSDKLLHNAVLVSKMSNITVYKICDLDLICMKLVSYRDKDVNDLYGLLMDCSSVTQYDIHTRLIYLYDKTPYDLLCNEAIRFVRFNVRVN